MVKTQSGIFSTWSKFTCRYVLFSESLYRGSRLGKLSSIVMPTDLGVGVTNFPILFRRMDGLPSDPTSMALSTRCGVDAALGPRACWRPLCRRRCCLVDRPVASIGVDRSVLGQPKAGGAAVRLAKACPKWTSGAPRSPPSQRVPTPSG